MMMESLMMLNVMMMALLVVVLLRIGSPPALASLVQGCLFIGLLGHACPASHLITGCGGQKQSAPRTCASLFFSIKTKIEPEYLSI